MRVEKDITVNAPVDHVYSMWTDFEHFPTFMEHVESVTQKSDNVYHWKAKIGPIVKEWDAEVQAERPNRSVTWRSISGAENAGAVTMSQRGNITELHVVIEYDPGLVDSLGDIVSRAMSKSVEEDLARFKRLAEGHDPNQAGSSGGPYMGEHGTGDQSSATYSRPT